MKLSGKKLTTAILAGLMGATMFGGSVFAAVTDQEFNEVRQGVNSNTQRISQLENAQSAAKDYSTDIAANKTAIADEATARTKADTELDTRITNVKDYLEKQTAADYVSKTDAAVQDGAVAKAGNTIGENVTNLDGALAKETAARIGADKAQDKVIKGVNDNLVSSVNTINKNIGTITDQLNKNDLAEAQTRAAADQTLQKNIDAEETARTDADTKLENRITNVKEYLEKQTADNYVSKSDAAVQDAGVVKADKKIGENVTALGKGLYDETAARIGADAAQDKVIKGVNDNLVSSVNTINKNIGTITDQLNKNDLAEAQARDAADQKLQGNIDAEAKTRDAADQTLQKNIDAEATARQTDVANLQKNITDSLTNQGKINETLTTAVQNNSKAIVESAKNLEKHLSDTDGRVDKANAEIHTNAGNIAQSQKDIADIQDTLKNANAFASADATKAANEAAEKANTVANGLKERVDLISNNQNVTSESDLIKKDWSIGQNLTSVDVALHNEIAARIGADAAQDKRINETAQNLTDLNTSVSNGFNAINNSIGTITGQLNKNDLAEQQARAAGDKALDTRITNVKEYLQNETEKNYVSKGMYNRETSVADGAFVKEGQTVGQNLNAVDKGLNDEIAARIGADAAQDKRINETAENLAGLNKNVSDGFTALSKVDQAEATARAAKDTEHDTAIAANKKAIEDEATARDAADQAEAKARADKDTAHDKAINDNTAAINKEVQDRTKAVADEAKARESGDNALQNQIKKESAARQADISRLDNKIHDVSKEVDTVGALSMAMSGLHPLSYDEGDARFQLSAAVGTYDGTEALALGGFYHFNRDSMLSVGVATDLGADEHRMGANVGYTRRIGQGGHVSRPSEGTVSDIMKDIKNLEQKQAKLEQENEQLKQQLAALKK